MSRTASGLRFFFPGFRPRRPAAGPTREKSTSRTVSFVPSRVKRTRGAEPSGQSTTSKCLSIALSGDGVLDSWLMFSVMVLLPGMKVGNFVERTIPRTGRNSEVIRQDSCVFANPCWDSASPSPCRQTHADALGLSLVDDDVTNQGGHNMTEKPM